MRFALMLALYTAVIYLIAERQFFDSEISCLDTYESCPESDSSFKDDEKNPPASYQPDIPWLMPDPFDEENVETT